MNSIHKTTFLLAALALASVASAQHYEARAPGRRAFARRNANGGAVAGARGPRGAVRARRTAAGDRGVAWRNNVTQRRGVAVEGRHGRRAAAVQGPNGSAWGFQGEKHRGVRVNARGKGTVAAHQGPNGGRFAATGKDGFVRALGGKDGGGLVVGGKRGEGAVFGIRNKQTGEWTGYRFDPSKGGWSDISQ
jgi:hypothetical protein